MASCADTLRELRDIDAKLASIPSVSSSLGSHLPELESQQFRVVRLIESSECSALQPLKRFVAHDDPSSVLLGWRNLVVDGLEPTEPVLPTVTMILGRLSGQRPIISTSEVQTLGPAHYENPWIDHARRVVAVLIARVEHCAEGESRSSGTTQNSDEQSGPKRPSQTVLGTARRNATGKVGDSRRDRRLRWLAEAMLTVRDHPEWSDAQIAMQVGINKSRLSRSQEYQTAAAMARTINRPTGSVRTVGGVRQIEAIDHSFDPNRKPSRQFQDEEDADDRLNREVDERNAKTQRQAQRGSAQRPVIRRSDGA